MNDGAACLTSHRHSSGCSTQMLVEFATLSLSTVSGCNLPLQDDNLVHAEVGHRALDNEAVVDELRQATEGDAWVRVPHESISLGDLMGGADVENRSCIIEF